MPTTALVRKFCRDGAVPVPRLTMRSRRCVSWDCSSTLSGSSARDDAGSEDGVGILLLNIHDMA